MKTLVLTVAIILSLTNLCQARTIIRKNALKTNQYDVYVDGKKTNSWQPDPFIKDQWNSRDSKSRKNVFTEDWEVRHK